MPSNPIPTDDIARHSAETKASGKRNVALWIVQAVLALVFVFAGAAKLVLATETLAKQAPLPVAFLRFIGVAETLGAIGLILPGLTRIRPELTQAAAAGLVIIMIGATVLTAATGSVAGALFPLIVGLLATTVAAGRSRQPVLS